MARQDDQGGEGPAERPPTPSLQLLDERSSGSIAKHRVLIADDNDSIRLMLRTLLSLEADFDVVGEAPDGIAALALVRRDDADLLILDLAMPGLDGLEVLEQLQTIRPGVRVAVYSGHAAADTEAAVRGLGARDFILKGVAPDELVARLRQAAAP